MKLPEVRARLSKRLQDPVVTFRRRDNDRRPPIAIDLVRVCSFREHAPGLSLAADLDRLNERRCARAGHRKPPGAGQGRIGGPSAGRWAQEAANAGVLHKRNWSSLRAFRQLESRGDL